MCKFDEKLIYVFYGISQFQPLEKLLQHERISKVDVNSIKKYTTEISHETGAERLASYIDFLKSYQSILSKRLPSEIANGMTNLMYAITFANASTEHVENAVVKWN